MTIPGFAGAQIYPQPTGKKDLLKVKHTEDFGLTGDGSAASWSKAAWLTLPQRNKTNVAYHTRVKMLYSDSGIYCLWNSEDKK